MPGTRESRRPFPREMLGLRPRSSMIERVLFDEEGETLRIRFRNLREYLYHGVPRAVFDALGKAASAGAFFNEAIKGRFRCEPLRRRFGPG